jgi:hypothetical protein
MKRAQKNTVVTRGRRGMPQSRTVTIDAIEESAIHVKVIVTTEDRILLGLNELLRAARLRQGWHVPAAMLLTELIACAAANFHEALGLSGQEWNTVLHVLLTVTLLWLVAALIRGGRGPSTSSFIDSLKNGQRSPDVRCKMNR